MSNTAQTAFLMLGILVLQIYKTVSNTVHPWIRLNIEEGTRGPNKNHIAGFYQNQSKYIWTDFTGFRLVALHVL